MLANCYIGWQIYHRKWIQQLQFPSERDNFSRSMQIVAQLSDFSPHMQISIILLFPVYNLASYLNSAHPFSRNMD